VPFSSLPRRKLPVMETAMTKATEAAAKANRVLIIDDDEELGELVTEYLRREGLEAALVHDGESGVGRALSGEYAVVVLDVMLPGVGGFEVLRRIRDASGAASRLPILMLTARGDEVDRVRGLELGADDYLPKPFSSRELVARLRAILRRAHVPSREASTPLRVSDIELDPATREVHRDGELLDLTSAEFDLLEVLLLHAGEIVGRETIARAALGRPLLPYDRSIDVHVSNLRRKLGPNERGGERIKSVRGVGYIYALAAPNGALPAT
jgi:DNA-binding response OmpR family regulator